MALTQLGGYAAHALPGRLRVRVPGLYRNPPFAHRLTAALGQITGVKRAGANADTGNVLVLYDPMVISVARIGTLLGLTGPLSPPPPSKGVAAVDLSGDSIAHTVSQARTHVILSGAAVVAVGLMRLSPPLDHLLTVASSYPHVARGLRSLVRDRHLTSDLIVGVAGLTSLFLQEHLLGLIFLFFTNLSGLRFAHAVAHPYQTDPYRLLPTGTETSRWSRWVIVSALLTGLLTGHWRRTLAAFIAAAPIHAKLAPHLPQATATKTAARRGIMLSGLSAMVTAGQVDTVLFDETGKLITGSPRVAEVLPVTPDWEAAEILSLAAAAEQRVFHPVGRAIRQEASVRHVEISRGLHQHTWVGGESMMIQRGLLGRRAKLLGQRLQLQHHSVVYVAVEGRVVGVIGLADQVRPEAQETVEGLRANGIIQVGLFAADPPEPARAVATALGLAPVWTGLPADGKATTIRAMQTNGQTVAVVGAGINDDPGLSVANLSVALSDGRTIPAGGSADAVVLDGDLRKAAELIRIGRRAGLVARQNQLLAAGMNVMGLGLAITGAISPHVATIWQGLIAVGIVDLFHDGSDLGGGFDASSRDVGQGSSPAGAPARIHSRPPW